MLTICFLSGNSKTETRVLAYLVFIAPNTPRTLQKYYVVMKIKRAMAAWLLFGNSN